MKKILTLCFALFATLLISSCSDPNSDIFHEAGDEENKLETTGGNVDDGIYEPSMPGSN